VKLISELKMQKMEMKSENY